VKLNDRQREAVDHRGGPLLVLAGAGTGKTRVITQRVAALIDDGVPPWRILAVTFTNKAATEMRERIHRACSSTPEISDLWVGTFHSIGARILRRMGSAVGLSPNFTIYDTSDTKALMKQVLAALDVSERQFSPGAVLHHIDSGKNLGHGPDDLHMLGLPPPVKAIVEKAWREYERRLRQADAADFGDLIVRTVALLEMAQNPEAGADLDKVVQLRRRFTHVVVDEYQDTSPIQAKLVEHLSGRAELCVVGDDDQSIYGWRGADVQQILGFPSRHSGTMVVRLEQNYRSTTHILDCADAVIRRNVDRHGKRLWSDLGPGEKVRVAELPDERAEARLVLETVRSAIDDGLSASDIAVFYRTHAQSRTLEEALRHAGVPYRIVGGLRFYDRAEIKDVLAYLRLLVNPNANVDIERVVNRPARRIGAATVEKLRDWADARSVSLWEAMDHAREAGLAGATAARIEAFRALILSLSEDLQGRPLDEAAEAVIERTGYREALAADDGEDAQSRLENLQEFLGALAEFAREEPQATLADYLERVALASADDQRGGEAVNLMTIHTAKGLEFERVVLTGMEERMFPHARALEDPYEMEEERRLAYVALTRAKRHLLLTHVARRWIYGTEQFNHPSRFVRELPASSVAYVGAARGPLAAARPQEVRPRWSSDSPFVEEEAPVRAKPERWDGDIEVDPEFEGGGAGLFVGMQLRHPKFGIGSVLGWQGAGQDLKVVVRFAGHGTKTILARFCEPL
jgi:DNA helicase-2/ATP-dependent DNA helicase PcrA